MTLLPCDASLLAADETLAVDAGLPVGNVTVPSDGDATVPAPGETLLAAEGGADVDEMLPEAYRCWLRDR